MHVSKLTSKAVRERQNHHIHEETSLLSANGTANLEGDGVASMTSFLKALLSIC